MISVVEIFKPLAYLTITHLTVYSSGLVGSTQLRFQNKQQLTNFRIFPKKVFQITIFRFYFCSQLIIFPNFNFSDVQNGYDNITGLLTSKLRFENVQIDDFGYYECLSDGTGDILQSFQLYINSSTKLLFPVPQQRTILTVNAGQSVEIPCRALNPINPDLEIQLISLESGLELPNVSPVTGPSTGFEIYQAKLPEHSGLVECIAKTEYITDTVNFTLNFNFPDFQNPDNVIEPPSDCKKCYELSKPYIQTLNQDVHEGDTVELKCILVVPKAIEDRVDLKWVKVALGSQGNQEILKNTLEDSPGKNFKVFLGSTLFEKSKFCPKIQF